MRILLCLLSDQHVPNLISVHQFRPERLVLVQSQAMERKNAAANLLKALELGRQDYGNRCDIIPLDTEDNLAAVARALRDVFGRYASADWIVNLSGGTKPMSIAAYEFFKAVGARLIYVNAHRPNVLLGLDESPAEQCAYRPSVDEFLAGYGFEARKNPAEIEAAQRRARITWDCARVIVGAEEPCRLLNLGNLSEPVNKLNWDTARKKGIELKPDQFGPAPAAVRRAVAACFGLEERDGSLAGKLDKYAVEFLTGGWLEVFLWKLLADHAESLGIWDVQLGVQTGKIDEQTSTDFDVAFMQGYRLAVIECKSGTQTNDPGADALHKLEAVVRQFRALLVNSFLATTADNVLDKSGQLRPGVRSRAAVYGSRIIDRHALRRLAAGAADVECVRRELFGTPTSTSAGSP